MSLKVPEKCPSCEDVKIENGRCPGCKADFTQVIGARRQKMREDEFSKAGRRKA